MEISIHAVSDSKVTKYTCCCVAFARKCFWKKLFLVIVRFTEYSKDSFDQIFYVRNIHTFIWICCIQGLFSEWQEAFSLRFTKQNFKHRLTMPFIALQLLMANFKYCVKYVELWTFCWSSFLHMWPKTKDLPWFLGACKLIKIRRKPVY